jgi:ankyrin repeat protein
MACQSGQKELAATLLDRHPSLRKENLDLPLQFATRNGHESLASLFNGAPES